MYNVVEGKLVRSNPWCPRCGQGTMMADHVEFYSCGKCGDRYPKKLPK